MAKAWFEFSGKELGCCAGASDAWFAGGQEAIVSYSPATEEAIGSVVPGNLDDYERVMLAATEAFQVWREVPAPKRGEMVRQIGEALRANKDALGTLVSTEMGKSKAEGDGEVQEMIDIAEFAVGQSRMLYGNTMPSERPQHRLFEQWHPLGVVGVISAFNFPVAVWSWNAFIAAVCGNVVVWKPSSKTLLCAIAVQRICNAVLEANGMPPVFSLLTTESHDVADRFVADERVALVSFTGSCQTGRAVYQTVASRMGRCLLELGGNNAVILDTSFDPKLAVPGIVFGAVGTAGQRCTSTRRLLVQREQLDSVCDQLVHAYEQIQIGDPLDTANHMGPLIDASAVAAYQKSVAEAKSLGARLLFGGDVLDGTGHYVQPTLFVADNEWDVVQRETFAPILYVMPYETLDEAIALQNAVPQGLSSSMFTQDVRSAERFLSAIGSDCGIANINIGTSGAEIGGAFGGEKETGGGREAGSDAWKAYMRRQTNTINWGSDLPLAQGINFSLS